MKDYPKLTGREPCRQSPESYFPGKGETVRSAKELCQGCPSFEGCREYAIHHSVDGIWGATSPRDRMAIRKARGIVPLPMPTVTGMYGHNFVHGTASGWRAHLRYDVPMCEECRQARTRYRRELEARKREKGAA